MFEPERSHGAGDGIVSLITTTGFLTGGGFALMREWLRRNCSHIWVLHLSPEGHHAPPGNQIFEAMRQPVAVVTAVRCKDASDIVDTPAEIRYHKVPVASREQKLDHIQTLLDPHSQHWTTLPADNTNQGWRAPFSPPAGSDYSAMPSAEDMFPWSGSGVMVGRTWPIHPDEATLKDRWQKLVSLSGQAQRDAFGEHKRDRRIDKGINDNLRPTVPRRGPIDDEPPDGSPAELRPYAHRSFDRKKIIADKRLINQPNPSMWAAHSDTHQMYLNVPPLDTDSSRPLIAQSLGAVVSFTDLIPDMHHLAGSRAGRHHPLWRDQHGKLPNIAPGLLERTASILGGMVTAEDLFAYIAAVVAHPGYTDAYREDLQYATALRVPLTAQRDLFDAALEIGRRVLWLHTFGQRYAPLGGPLTAPIVGDPRRRPKVVAPIPDRPDRLSHNATTCTLTVHSADPSISPGLIKPVIAEVFDYRVAHMDVLTSWFDARKAEPAGTRTSELSSINPVSWLSSYTHSMIDLLNILTMLVDLRPDQQQLLDNVTRGPLIDRTDLEAAGVLPPPDTSRQRPSAWKRDISIPGFDGAGT